MMHDGVDSVGLLVVLTTIASIFFLIARIAWTFNEASSSFRAGDGYSIDDDPSPSQHGSAPSLLSMSFNDLSQRVIDEVLCDDDFTKHWNPLLGGDFLGLFKRVSQSKALQATLNSFDFKPQSGLKCEKMAVAHRFLGMKQMQSDKLTFALKSMNLSLTLSPVLPNEKIDLPTALSSTYNCRSQLLFRMKQYHACISDVLHAMKNGCANEEIADLFERQGLCCERLKELGKAVECYEQAIAHGSKLHGEKFIKQCLHNIKNKFSSNVSYPRSSPLNIDFNPLPWKPAPPLLNGPHSIASCVSKALTLAHSQVRRLNCPIEKQEHGVSKIENPGERQVQGFYATKYPDDILRNLTTTKCSDVVVRDKKTGKHPAERKASAVEVPRAEECLFVAAKDIDAGSVIVVEKPFVWSLFKASSLDHCGGCTRKCEVITPCRGCSAVIYCSDECEESTWNNYHQLECLILPHVLSIPDFDEDPSKRSFISILLRALCRFITMRPTRTKVAEKMERTTVFNLLSGEVEYIGDDNAEQMFDVAVLAGLMLHLLDVTSTFEKCFPNRTTNESLDCYLKKKVVASLLNLGDVLPHMHAKFSQSTLANESAHNLMGALLLCFGMSYRKYNRTLSVFIPSSNGNLSIIGRAFYPSAALFEKSCYPHAMSIAHGITSVVRTLRHVRRGERITIGYNNCSFPRDDFETRRHKLRFSECRCPVCTAQLSACGQVSLLAMRCSRCGDAIRDISPQNCAGCGHSVRGALTAFVDDWSACAEQLALLANSPLDTAHVGERFLRIFRPIDRRAAEPFLTKAHSACVEFLTLLFRLQGHIQPEYK